MFTASHSDVVNIFMDSIWNLGFRRRCHDLNYTKFGLPVNAYYNNTYRKHKVETMISFGWAPPYLRFPPGNWKASFFQPELKKWECFRSLLPARILEKEFRRSPTPPQKELHLQDPYEQSEDARGPRKRFAPFAGNPQCDSRSRRPIARRSALGKYPLL